MTLASENYRSGQPISEYIQNNLAPHFSPDLINPQHFCHSARRKPVRLSKSGKTGLTVRCELDTGQYPNGIVVSDAEMAATNIKRAAFHGEWNYTISPNHHRPNHAFVS